jgi:hypothetical protein
MVVLRKTNPTRLDKSIDIAEIINNINGLYTTERHREIR